MLLEGLLRGNDNVLNQSIRLSLAAGPITPTTTAAETNIIPISCILVDH